MRACLLRCGTEDSIALVDIARTESEEAVSDIGWRLRELGSFRSSFSLRMPRLHHI
jgi:hypothetical protein